MFRGLAVTVLGTGVRVVSADEAQNARQLVDKARFTFNDFVVNKVMQPFRALLKQAGCKDGTTRVHGQNHPLVSGTV